MAIRLGPSEWPNLGTPLGDGNLMSLLADTGRSPGDVHVVVDWSGFPATPRSSARLFDQP